MFTGPDWAIRWPSSLLVSEAIELLNGRSAGEYDWEERAALLLEEAFESNVPRDEIATVRAKLQNSPDDPRFFLLKVVRVADTFKPVAARAPYWIERGRQEAERKLTREAAQREFAGMVIELEGRGYFARSFDHDCVDCPVDVDAAISRALANIFGSFALWPLPDSLPWADDVWFTLIEFFHDHAARPRSRYFHDFSGCGWHYSSFALEPGQTLYRWQINDLLERGGIRLRLGENGEDVGRLVVASDDSRRELLDALVEAHLDMERDPVVHAISLFRRRGATFEEKRSAAVALAGVLEERRSVLKDELLSNDEGALFHVANQFGIRHQNERQLDKYGDEFIDWICWLFLSTVELTDRLIHRSY